MRQPQAAAAATDDGPAASRGGDGRQTVRAAISVEKVEKAYTMMSEIFNVAKVPSSPIPHPHPHARASDLPSCASSSPPTIAKKWIFSTASSFLDPSDIGLIASFPGKNVMPYLL